jgi:hypothetical protein
VTLGACHARDFDNKTRFQARWYFHHVTGQWIDCNIYNESLHGTDKQYGELFRDDGGTIRVCESSLVRAHRTASDLWRSCAQKAQFHAGKDEAVLYTVAGRADIEYIKFCSVKRAQSNLKNEIE